METVKNAQAVSRNVQVTTDMLEARFAITGLPMLYKL